MSWSKVIKSPEIYNHEINSFFLESKKEQEIYEFVPMKKKEDKDAKQEPSQPIQDTKQIKEEAYKQGLSEGKKAGLKAAQKRVEGLIEEIGKNMERLKDLEINLRKACEREIVELALAIARKIIMREIKTDPNTIAHIACTSLEKIPFSPQIRIRVNPADWEDITKEPFEAGGYKDITIEPDDTIIPGGCYLETELGEIDICWEEQLKEIENLFKALIPQPAGVDKKKRKTKKT
jgi:flagellar assembly protein FliH